MGVGDKASPPPIPHFLKFKGNEAKMPKQKRYATDYPGVFYILGTAIGSSKPEKIFYVRFRKDGKMVEEKAGRSSPPDDMTASRANNLRSDRMRGKKPTNAEKRDREKAKAAAAKNKPTFNILAELYWEIRQADGKSPKAINVDKGRYEKHLKDEFGEKCPDELTEDEMFRFTDRKRQTLRQSTVDKLTGLLTWIDNATEKRHSHRNMAFKMPKLETAKDRKKIIQIIDRALGDNEFKKLMQTAWENKDSEKADIRDACHLVLLAGNSANRNTALKSLKWENIDFYHGKYDLAESIIKSTGHTFTMNPKARQILRERWIRAGQPEKGWVFPSRSTRKTFFGHWENTSRDVWKVYKLAGLEHLKGQIRPLHSIRHYLAKLLIKKNVPVKKVQAFLGHDSIHATLIYTDVDAEAKKETVDMIDTLFDYGN
jgi:site-specific recombinase XerD